MKDLIDRKAGRMKLIDAPVGVFVFHDELVLKTEYMTNIDGVYIPDCYILSTGEKFWGGMKSKEDFKTKYNNLDVEVIDIMPSAHLESKRQATVSSDCISRQDAIDAFWKLEVELRPSAIDAVLNMLKNLPSAQSEQLEKCPIYGGVCLHPSDQCYACPRHAGAEQIIRCTNCRFFKRNIPCTGGHYNGCEMWLDDGNEIRVMTDDYCSKALPKEGEEE